MYQQVERLEANGQSTAGQVGLQQCRINVTAEFDQYPYCL